MAQVLVADADSGIRDLLVDLLTEAGHNVVAVTDGATALDLLHTVAGSAVAVLDVGMPHLHGLDTLQKFVGDPQVALRHGIVLLTALPSTHFMSFQSALLAELPAGAVVVNKPFDLEDLEQAVASVAAEARDRSKRMAQRTWYTRVLGGVHQKEELLAQAPYK